MLRYSKFMFCILSKKISIYIMFLLMSLIVFIMSYFQITEKNSLNRTQGLDIGTFFAWFPFVFSSIFSSLLIIRIFKTGEKDGTELLISAKPLTRYQIIFGKFFTNFVLLFLYHFLAFFVYFAISFIDKYASLNQKLKFAISLAVGGFIIMIIINAIIIIISAFLNRVATIIMTILFAAAIPIISFTIVPTSGANVSTRQLPNKNYFLYNFDKDNKDFSNGYVFNNKKNDIYVVQYARKNSKSWYKTVKYFDMWYQWGRLYSLFKDSSVNSFSIKHAKIQTIDKKVIDKDYKEALKGAIRIKDSNNNLKKIILFSQLGMETYKQLISFDKKEYKKIINEKSEELIKKIDEAENKIKKINKEHEKWINKLNLEKDNKMQKSQRSELKGYEFEDKEVQKTIDTNKKKNKILKDLLIDFIKKNNSNLKLKLMNDKDFWKRNFGNNIVNINLDSSSKKAPQLSLFILKFLSDLSYKHKNLKINRDLFDSFIAGIKEFERSKVIWYYLSNGGGTEKHMLRVIDVEEKDNFIKSTSKLLVSNSNDEKSKKEIEFLKIDYKDFLSTTPLLIFWSSIAVILFGFSIFVYIRRDFR